MANPPPDLQALDKAFGYSPRISLQSAEQAAATTPTTAVTGSDGGSPNLRDVDAAFGYAPPPAPTEAPSPTPGAAAPPPVSAGSEGEGYESPREVWSHLKEFVYPTKKESEGGVINDTLETLPDWHGIPELNNPEHAMLPDSHKLAVLLGTAMAGPKATKDIVEKQLGIPVVQHGGYLVMHSNIDGNYYAWKPGFRSSDIGRGLLGALEFGAGSKLASGVLGAGAKLASSLFGTGAAVTAPAAAGAVAGGALAPAAPGLLANVAAHAGKALAGSTAAELMKYGAGGDFSPGSVALQTGLGAVAPVVGSTMGVAQDLMAGGSAAAGKDLGQTLGQGVRGNPWAQNEYAASIGRSPKVVDAARYLGTDVTPDMAATNPEAVALSQKVLSSGTGHAVNDAAMQRAGKAIQAVFEKMGADIDASTVNANTVEAVTKLHDQLTKTVEKLYKNLVPGDTPVPDAARKAIDKFIEGYPGKLPKLLQRVRRQLAVTAGKPTGLLDSAGKPILSAGESLTYQTIDDLVKDVGAATKGPTIWKSPDKGLAQQTYKLLNRVRDLTAESVGKGPELGAAQAAFRERVRFEKAITRLLGRQIEGAISGDAVPGAVSAFSNATKGNTTRLIQTAKAVSGLPTATKRELMTSALLSAIRGPSEENPVSFAKAVNVLGGLFRNTKALPAIASSLDPDAPAALRHVYELSKGIKQMTDARVGTGLANDAYRQLTQADVVAEKAADAIRHGTTILGGLAGSHVGHDYAGAMIGRGLGSLIGHAIKGEGRDIIAATTKFLTSPEFAQLPGYVQGVNPLSQPAFRRAVTSPVYRGLMNALKMPSSTYAGWLGKILDTAHVASQAAGNSAADRLSQEAQ